MRKTKAGQRQRTKKPPRKHERLLTLEEIMDRDRARGLGWRYDGLEDWTTEAIFSELAELGVSTSADEFPRQALLAGDAEPLGDSWIEQAGIEGIWEDFPVFASLELWKRLTPDIVCPSLLGMRLDDALGATEEADVDSDEYRSAVAPTLAAIADFLMGFSVADRPARLEELQRHSIYDIPGVIEDFVEYARGTDIDLLRRLVAAMASCEPEGAPAWWADLAYAYMDAGRPEEAAAQVEVNCRQFPDNGYVQSCAGDVFRHTGDLSRALHHYEQALARAKVPELWDDMVSLIESTIEGREGSQEEIERIKQAHPRPPELLEPLERPEPPWTPAFEPDVDYWPDAVEEPPQPYIAPRKIGPNEPCPCGSGKKYKKCCRP